MISRQSLGKDLAVATIQWGEREVLVGLGDGADVVKRVDVGLAREDLPDRLAGAAHTTIPRRRIVSRASSRIRSLVQTGSQTM